MPKDTPPPQASQAGAESRLLNLEHMSHNDWLTILKQLVDDAHTKEDHASALRIAAAIRINIDTEHRIDKMDRDSSAVARKLLWLTWVITILTALLVIDVGIKVFKEVRASDNAVHKAG
ncbi:hypothetical protein [Zavarzinella formosa]|uniref:hypothetical protein n=1 Tax=Zavarzinella formosa TaxID=360055 RepID=UPI00037E8D31|nr:hypothetical protein [Zavarzinella formosa]